MTVSDVLRKFRATYIIIWIHSIFIAVLGLTPFLYMMQISSRVQTSRSWETFGFITAIIVFFMVIWGLLDHFRGGALRSVGYQIDHALRTMVFDAVHRSATPDAFRAYSDIASLRSGLTGGFISNAFDASLAPLFIAVLFLLHPVFGWTVIGFIIVIALLSVRARSVWKEVRAEAKPYEDQAFAFGIATASKSDAIRAMGILPGIRKAWSGLQSDATDRLMAGQTRASRTETVIGVMQKGQIVLIIGVGAVLFLLDEVTASAGFAAFIITMRGVNPILAIARNWGVVQEVRDAMTRLDGLLEQHQPVERVPLPPLKGAVVCDQVGVVTHDGHSLLQGIKFSVPAGSVVGVIGPSGAGKTTLLRVLAGAKAPSVGTVKVDGFAVDQWPEEQWGASIGYLPQSVDLLPGTIWQNVARFCDFNDEANDAVLDALQGAGALDIVQDKNRGLDFALCENGAPLSGGQKQRIGLARAFFNSPKLIVLDEPSASLDSEGEKTLMASIATLKAAGSTVFFSTHKADLLPICDYIVVIMDGYLHSFSTTDDILQRFRLAQNPAIPLEDQGAST